MPPATHLERVLGFGRGRGLDLSGYFPYAFNLGGSAGAGPAGDANFTAGTAPRITVNLSNETFGWSPVEFGSSTADDVLKTVLRSHRWVDTQSRDSRTSCSPLRATCSQDFMAPISMPLLF